MTPDLPPNIVGADRAVVRDLAAWGIPTPPATIRVGLPDSPRYAAGPTIASAGQDGIRVAPRVAADLPDERYRVMAHERLHILSEPWSQTIPAGLTRLDVSCMEEAAADAVSMDLVRDHYMRAPARVFFTTPGYGPATRWLRLVSMRATGADWRTPPAIAWRVTFLRSTVATRAALVADDPERCPTADFEETR